MHHFRTASQSSAVAKLDRGAFVRPHCRTYTLCPMGIPVRTELMKVIAARVVDLRSEFEAQLRAVARLEEQLRKIGAGKDEGSPQLEDVLRRALVDMVTNNANIRGVLTELSKDARGGAPV